MDWFWDYVNWLIFQWEEGTRAKLAAQEAKRRNQQRMTNHGD